MRYLVQCQKCDRQYDSGRRQVGARFYCFCGEVLVVRDFTENVEAKSIKCSNCGSARKGKELTCSFCGDDFTIHERDMHTVCPKCTARVSDRAKFCSRCGSAISAELAGGEESEAKCPSCSSHPPLVNRQIAASKISFMECSLCAGMWMARAQFQDIIEKSRQGETPLVMQEQFPKTFVIREDVEAGGVTETTRKRAYINCPECQGTMLRKNFSEQSGVIVDFCRDHGFWLDANELAEILAFIKSGGMKKAEEDRVKNQARPVEKKSHLKMLGDTLMRTDHTSMGVLLNSDKVRAQRKYGQNGNLFEPLLDLAADFMSSLIYGK